MNPFALPMMMAELTAASFETMWHRTALMMSGQCSPMEYQRMVTEKMQAAEIAASVLLAGGTAEAMLRPYYVRARANAKRLRG